MSHFTVTVALPGTLTEDQIEAELAKALAPFDENKDVPRYVKYTREQLIEKGREEIEQYRDTRYAEWRADPAAYVADCSNISHLEYIGGGAEALSEHPEEAVRAKYAELLIREQTEEDPFEKALGRKRRDRTPLTFEESFPAKLEWTDEQVYASEIRWEEESNLGPEGEVYSEYNPQSQWDWYSVGGRWANFWLVHEKAEEVPVERYDAVKEFTEISERIRPEHVKISPDREYLNRRDARPGRWEDIARKCDIDFAGTVEHSEGRDHYATFAFLDSDGKWHERGEMGWWGIVTNESAEDEWYGRYEKLVAAEADNAWFVLCDCHI